MFGFLAFISFLLMSFSIYNVVANRINKARKERNEKNTDKYNRESLLWSMSFFSKTLPIWIVSFVIFFIVSLWLVTVDGQQVAVVVTPSGVDNQELHTGWHLVMPWYNVFYMDKTYWVYSFTNDDKEGERPTADAIWCPTKDGIKMGFDLSVTWRISPDEASWIYSNVSEQDEERYLWIEENIIRPKIKSVMPLTVSKFNPIECYSYKRQEIQNEIFDVVKAELKDQFKLDVLKVDIREVFYNPEYERAINEKKLAEQKALTLIEVTKQQRELLTQEEIKKNIEITKAEGLARALQIKGQSISNNPKIIELEWVNKWNGQLPTYMMGNDSGVLINLDGKK